MGTAIRIVIAIVCAAALYYLIVTLARSVSRGSEKSSLDRPAAHLALARPGAWTPASGRRPGF